MTPPTSPDDVSGRSPFLTAEWRNLLMLNFEIPQAYVEPYLPHGLEIDDFQGRTYVSLVGFQFLQTKLRGWSIPWHRNFPEVNLRLYVRRKVGDEIRRGVVFVKEIVPRSMVTWVARWCYNEPYQTLPVRDEISVSDDLIRAQYDWGNRGNRCTAAAVCPVESQPLAAGSLEEFIAEHYWGYGRRRDHSLVEYQVAHPSWRFWTPFEFSLKGDFERIYGRLWGEVLRGPPASVFLADGSPIQVYPPC